jgi:hypothetical protein
VSDINTVVVDSLKELDAEWPIREVVDSLKELDPEWPIRQAEVARPAAGSYRS